MDTFKDYLALIIASVSLLAVLGNIYWQFRSGRRQEKKEDRQEKAQDKIQDVQFAKTFQEIATAAAMEVSGLKVRLKELEVKVMELEKDNQRLCETVDSLKEWADSLVYQIKTLGAQPVPYVAPKTLVKQKE